tara:strand:+ start:672 stop:1862 length:1191 start_codon:yes stop_codon:yes gene_type:complete
MTVIQPNSISGVSSITAQGGDISIFRADGTAGDLVVNNINAGVSTFSGNLNVGGVLTYEDVTNIDSVGVITARDGLRVTGIATISGDVIIGHTAANGKLQVNNGTNSAVGDSANPAFQIGGTTTYRLGIFTTNEQVIIGNKNGDDGIAFHTKTASSGSFGEALRIDSSGFVKQSFSSDNSTVAEGIFINNKNNGTGNNASLIFSNDSGERKKASISYIDTGNYGTGDMVFSLDNDADSGSLHVTNHERMRISKEGYVTKSNQPSFTARSTNTWGHASSTGLMDLDINMSEEFDVGNNYNGQIFTAPVAGKYFFSYTFQYKNTSGYLVVSLRKGVSGSYSSYGRMHVYPPQQSAIYSGPGIIGIMDLAAGNTVKPMVEVNYAGNQIQNVNFSGYLLG